LEELHLSGAGYWQPAKREKMKLEVKIIGRKSKRTKLLISLNP
jgi:hypothetical protein